MKHIGIVALAAVLCACGGDAITLSEPLELETAEEPLIADNNFGILSGTLRQCNPGSTGQCWYPSGFGSDYPWRVCPKPAGMTQSQNVKATAAQLHVMQTLRNGGAEINFDCGAGGGPVPHIQIFKGPAPGLGCGSACDIDDARRYVTLFCTSSMQLAESPSISGQHAYCYRYNVEIDYNAIDAVWSNETERAHVYEHVTGFALAAATLGTGLHSAATLNHYWTYDNVNPLQKSDVHPADYCRADADYEGIDFFFIRKQDNACD
jgi:hypothetical protein